MYLVKINKFLLKANDSNPIPFFEKLCDQVLEKIKFLKIKICVVF